MNIKRKIQAANENDVKELYLFKDLPMVTDDVITKLISEKGWTRRIFSEIEQYAPRCQHGHIVAFYCDRRNAILIPGKINGMEVTYSFTQTDVSIHMFGLTKNSLYSQERKSKVC